MTQVASNRTNESHFDVIEKAEHHEPALAASVGLAYDKIAVQNEFHILEVDLPLFQRPFAFGRVESDVTDSIE